MYGDELQIVNAAIADGCLATAVNINAAANTVALLKTMELPGSVLYWGYRVTTAFDVHDVVTPGLLTLYRYTKRIQTAVLGNAGGTGYAVGDLLSVTQTGASGGIVRVLTAPAGVVATVEVVNRGWNYTAASNLATVALNGSGNNAFTTTISDKKALDTISLAAKSAVGVTLTTIWALFAGYLQMKRVPITLSDTSPSDAPPNGFLAGEGLAIEVTTMVNGDVHETGAYQPIIIVQNRAENLAAQGLWVEATST
jgi:hypothetical protein